MFKYLKAAAFAVTVVASSCVSISAYADGPLPPPSVSSGQTGANRRVITTKSGYTAVRGSFTVPTEMKASFPSIFELTSANSKPSFYLGLSRRNSFFNVEVDAGIAYEWEAIPFEDVDGVIKVASPGWSIFSYANRIGNKRLESNPRGGWRCGPGTLNPVSRFDLTWVTLQRVRLNQGLPDYYGYLEVNAVGASAQPMPKPGQDDFGNTVPCRLVPFRGNDGTGESYDAKLTDSTSGMSVKRVVCISQGGSYTKRVVRDDNGVKKVVSVPGIRSVLNFPLPSGGIYDEDGSYMRNCRFQGVGGTGAGQVYLGPPRRGQAPAWTDWSNHVDQSDLGAAGTGFYPDGSDQTLSQYEGESIKSFLSRPYFEFPTLNAPNNSQNPERYNDETVSINLRRGINFSASGVAPGAG